MKKTTARKTALLALSLLILLPCIAQAPQGGELPQPIDSLVYAEHFTVEQPFEYSWSADKPQVREGTILVIDADPQLVRPRNADEPLLYVGEHVAWRITANEDNGRLIAFVAARVDWDSALVFFGEPGLAERVDRQQARAASSAAAGAGLSPLPASMVEAALRRSAEDRRFLGRLELLEAIQRIASDYRAIAPRYQQ